MTGWLDWAAFMSDSWMIGLSRWKLRQAIKAVNEVMNDRMVVQHPDKTFIMMH